MGLLRGMPHESRQLVDLKNEFIDIKISDNYDHYF